MSDLNENIISFILVYINFIFIIKLAAACFKVIDLSLWYITIWFLLASAVYYFYKYILKNRVYIFIFNIILITTVIGVNYYIPNILNNIFIQYIGYFKSINEIILNSKSIFFNQFKYVFMLIVLLLTVIELFLSNKIFRNTPILINLLLMIFLWYYGFLNEIEKYMPYYIAISLITYAVNQYKLNLHKSKDKDLEVSISWKSIILYIIMSSISIATIITILPKNYSGNNIKQMSTKLINSIIYGNMDLEDEYDLSSSGYDNNDKKLGGPIIINDDVVLKVDSSKLYYLKGNVKKYYNGTSWKNTEEKDFMKVKDTDQMAIPRGMSFNKDSGGSFEYIKISPIGINTSTFFVPNYVNNIKSYNKNIFYNKENCFIAESQVRKPYELKIYSDASEIGLMSKNIKDNYMKYVIDAEYKTKNGEDLSQYKEYLQLPDSIPERVYNLVKNITKDAKNNSEKLERIYDYLNKNYKYSTQVSRIPNEREFLDYFLFDEKKGYCTYFATATTIFCRISGIPARYVEGFKMTDKKDDTGVYIVTNKNAHAWAEVLLSPKYNTWSVFDCVPDAEEEINKEENNKNNEKLDETVKNDENISKDDANKSAKPKEIEDDIKSKGISKINTLLIIIIVIICLIIFKLILIILNKYKIINSKSIIPLYMYTLSRLKSIGIKKEDYVGELEFASNIEDMILKNKLEEITKIALREFYGEKIDTRFNKREFYYYIETYIKENSNTFKYYIKK